MRYGKRFINKMRMFYQRPIHGVSKKCCKVYFALYHILKRITHPMGCTIYREICKIYEVLCNNDKL